MTKLQKSPKGQEVSVKVFDYKGHLVGFELKNKSVMVNATEMAKAFGKNPADFLKIDQTEDFLKECCSNENYYELLGIEPEVQDEDLHLENENSGEVQDAISHLETRKKSFLSVVHGGRNNGTWMHEILALKFAAWLNPKFELWVYRTIRDILFGEYAEIDRQIKDSAKRKAKIQLLREDLTKNPPQDERVTTLFELEAEDKKEARKPFTQLGKKSKEEVLQYIIEFGNEKSSNASPPGSAEQL